LLDSEGQASTVRKLIWNAAGYSLEESAGRMPEFSIKDKRNAIIPFFRLLNSFTKNLRFQTV
jgi:hypothetical protein